MTSASAQASSASSSASSVSCDRLVRLGDAAVRGDDGAEREAVDVVDLAGRERRARLDDFVAGRQDRRRAAARTPRPRSRRWRPARRSRLGFSRSPRRTTRSPGVMSAPRRPMFWPGGDRQLERRLRLSPAGACLLDHHHGVGAVGQRRAGGDLRAGARLRSRAAAVWPV